MSSPSRPFARHLYYLALGLFAVWCALRLQADLVQLPHMAWQTLLPAITLCTALSLLNYVLRALRWKRFLDRISQPIRFHQTLLYYLAGFAFTLSPGKVGELARLRYYQPHGISTASVTAAFFMERLLDVVAVAALSLLFIWGQLSGSTYQPLVEWSGVIILAILCGLACSPWQRWQSSPRAWLSRLAHTLGDARTLLSPSVFLFAICLSFLAWGAEAYGLSVLLQPMDAHVTLPSAMGIYAIAVLAGAVSFLPGGLGGTEAVMTALLHQQGLPLGEALLATLLCRLLTLWLAVVLGWLTLLHLRHHAQ